MVRLLGEEDDSCSKRKDVGEEAEESAAVTKETERAEREGRVGRRLGKGNFLGSEEKKTHVQKIISDPWRRSLHFNPKGGEESRTMVGRKPNPCAPRQKKLLPSRTIGARSPTRIEQEYSFVRLFAKERDFGRSRPRKQKDRTWLCTRRLKRGGGY